MTFEKLQERKPEEIIKHAIKGMLPDGKLGRQMFKLKVYVGPEHAHTAQKPGNFRDLGKGRNRPWQNYKRTRKK